MFKLASLTEYIATHGALRKSQRKTLTALVSALMSHPILGIASIGHRPTLLLL